MTPEIKRLPAEVDSRICPTCSDLAASCLDDEREAVDARCQRLEAAAEALDALMAWAGEMRAYLPRRAKDEIDAAEAALARLEGVE